MNLTLKRIIRKYADNGIIVYSIKPLWRFLMRLKFKSKQRLFRKYAHEVLSNFSTACRENDITFWLEFGTMLGAYRDKGFITHDFDLDVAIFYEDAGKLHKALASKGFKIKRKFQVIDHPELGLEFTYEYKKVPIDIFVFHRDEAGMHTNSFTPIYKEIEMEGYAEVKEISFGFQGIEEIEFLGIKVGIPSDIVDHLALNYGPTFMTPDKHFDYKKIAKNIKYYKRQERLAKYEVY